MTTRRSPSGLFRTFGEDGVDDSGLVRSRCKRGSHPPEKVQSSARRSLDVDETASAPAGAGRRAPDSPKVPESPPGLSGTFGEPGAAELVALGRFRPRQTKRITLRATIRRPSPR